MAKAVVEFMHRLKITMEGARIYRERGIHGETVIVGNGTETFVLFKGVKGYYLKSPKLFRRSVPVKFVYA